MKPVVRWLILLSVVVTVLAVGAIVSIIVWPEVSQRIASQPATPTVGAQKAEAPASPTPDGPHDTPNRLIHEKSPYLLQHAYNPVDWFPWGEEAFEKARRENKPIFLSIGYSTCHWCHVMEEESFEDPEVAQLLNETFVSIKVDREERPDIDSYYMQVAAIMTGSGGWPLNVMMTPDKKPFFASTYIPKENRFGRIGMLELIPQVQAAWLNQDTDLLDAADQIAEVLETGLKVSTAEDLAMDEALLTAAYQQLVARFDAQNGGFGQAPKFPTPHNLLFLLRYWERTGDEAALQMVEKTLQAMRQGGVYDQVGFGFHRYSTDAIWLVPHFEKMLYDQALLALAYTEAYQATGKAEYEQTAREIFTYVLRDMTAPNGGFYSAEDADSEGEEGKFYVWTADEIRQVLDKKRAELVITAFNVTDEGNFVDPAHGGTNGTNILHLTQSMPELAAQLRMSERRLASQLDSATQQLFFEVREARIHPHKDDKILADWNGLMIAALAKGGRVFDDPTYTQAAENAADFILLEMRDENGRLLHRYRDGEAALIGNVDDYTFVTWGLLELYETDFDTRYLEPAIHLTDDLLGHFWDEEGGGLYFTPDDGEDLLSRQKLVFDGVIPSGNSVAMLNLLRLGRITANSEYEAKAVDIGNAFGRYVQQEPSSYSLMMTAINLGVGPSYEVVIVGQPEAKDTLTMLTALRGEFIPNKVVLLRPPEESPSITRLAEFTRYHSLINDQATAYVCLNYYCELPTNDVDMMLELLGKKQ